MKFADIFLTTLYDHSNSLQKRGRNQVIPWLHTTFAVALLLTLSTFCIIDIVRKISLKEYIFLPIFFLLGCFFFLIKHSYFDSGKNLTLLDEYLRNYSSKKQLFFKVTVITTCCLIPFLLVVIIDLRRLR